MSELNQFVLISDEILEELICGICLDVFVDPLITRCCHRIYCRQCITSWLTNSNICPNDRKRLDNNSLEIAPTFVINLLTLLKVECIYKDFGCQSCVKPEDLETHQIDCHFNPFRKTELKETIHSKQQYLKELGSELQNHKMKLALLLDAENDLAGKSEPSSSQNSLEALKSKLDSTLKTFEDLLNDVMVENNRLKLIESLYEQAKLSNLRFERMFNDFGKIRSQLSNYLLNSIPLETLIIELDNSFISLDENCVKIFYTDFLKLLQEYYDTLTFCFHFMSTNDRIHKKLRKFKNRLKKYSEVKNDLQLKSRTVTI